MNRKFVMGLFLVGIMISTITIGLKFILLDFHFKEEYEWGSDKDFFDNPCAVSPIANSSSFFVIDEEGVKILGLSSWRGNHLILRGNLSVPNNNFTDIAFGSDGLSYVLDEKSGLFVFNISLTESTQNPQIISELQIDENFDGLFKEILVKDDFAYLAAGYNGVIIVNVSNPTDPVVIGKHYDNFGKDNYLEDGASFGLNVRKEEGRTMIFVADWGDGLEILDATDPVNIKKVTELSIYGPENTPIKARDVELMGNYAYLATTSGVISVDISNKYQVNNMSAQLVLPRKNGKAWSLEKKGEFLFVSFGIDVLKTFKMTDNSTL